MGIFLTVMHIPWQAYWFEASDQILMGKHLTEPRCAGMVFAVPQRAT